MYDEITKNNRRTILLISIFSIIIVVLGWFFGLLLNAPETGIFLAVIFATIFILIGYFKGDVVALTTAGAKLVEKKDLPELYRLVENLSITAGIPTPKIYLITDPAANACATGRKPETASIAVTTGLLQILSKQELEGVIAHELSHIKNYDIRIMTLVVVLVGTILLLSDVLLHSFLFRRGNSQDSQQATVILFFIGILLAILSPLFAQLIKFAVSRSREYLADASASLLTRYPDGLAQALQKIAAQDLPLKHANHATAHLFLANPFDPHVTKRFEHLFSTHPPIEERIRRLQTIGGHSYVT
ncbi:MAG: Protease HtpX-like protein [Candidatus Uhrbacteria bacterium GW2011_GWE2_40_58]|nr:MAG: Protease HtpX-like protein [Candidatus Uhrbacteria bacterium GW2011_GWF2_40_263]KKR68173.1 MAG: Protease HtpX-like protein [Candidatus Uhrbacteria bacterium GW2011_GWE2_40_58]OGL91861.1 MAG: zinc metalloprotease HtpX [Candidatus Uhrbacteria bacterium RIFOXYA2_FULL_40_9]OGL97671.1 MAG: zinc metalloprotease HtpX [Candidatus Uhrbacteria bacterium RIFOXYB2_FULL_41_18]HBK34662.1 zinc metalloprotease HtpX [Candidatus Uhrbacteria bacterium]